MFCFWLLFVCLISCIPLYYLWHYHFARFIINLIHFPPIISRNSRVSHFSCVISIGFYIFWRSHWNLNLQFKTHFQGNKMFKNKFVQKKALRSKTDCGVKMAVVPLSAGFAFVRVLHMMRFRKMVFDLITRHSMNFTLLNVCINHREFNWNWNVDHSSVVESWNRMHAVRNTILLIDIYSKECSMFTVQCSIFNGKNVVQKISKLSFDLS